MKDNISIIFTAIIGTFLIVLLPLYSILDRQDSMSYNVVLTSTTNFVDDIRNNGFVDRDSYYNYISKLASTANTYKVVLEAYRKTLIRDIDEYGNVINDSYVEQIELYNTQDILEVLEGETNINTDSSNEKNNVFLFDVNDEIYVKVYNTNTTAGSLIYNVIAGVETQKVINISYGGIVNKINWELYDKIQAETTLVPEVVMSVPVNGINSTNITQIDNNIPENIDCSIENLDEHIGETDLQEICGDTITTISGEDYTYLYDLAIPANKTIKVAVELRRFDSIVTGVEKDEESGLSAEVYTKLEDLKATDFDDLNGTKSAVESYIIQNYIQTNGMIASVDLDLRKTGDYYVFDIILTNVRMSALDYVSSLASITILPGLGKDENETLSIGAETVQIELTDATAVNTVQISQPHIWLKLLKTKNPIDARILDETIYANEEIAFIISYTGINNQTDEAIVEAIKNNLKVYINDAQYSEIEFITAKELNDNYGINIMTDTAGHVVIKFKYTASNNSKQNYIELLDGWIATNIEDVIDAEQDEELLLYANGAISTEYSVLLDDVAPLEPGIELSGALGDNDWYTSDVLLNLIEPKSDTVRKTIIVDGEDGNQENESKIVLGGSGVYKTTLTLEGAEPLQEKEQLQTTIEAEGISYAIGSSYDYVGNKIETNRKEIKIDKTSPTSPKIVVLKGTEGTNSWYTSDVVVDITPGTDAISGTDRTTYRIEGANQLDETVGTRYTITKQGKSTIIATTYDKAGNKNETSLDIYIDKSTPPDAKIEVIKGEKNSLDNKWYTSDVTLRITVDAPDSISGLGISSYRITGSSEVSTTKFEGTTKEITITENGTHNITVYTYTAAGNVKETKYTIEIDKNAPNIPTVELIGTNGDNEWYTSNVEVNITSNGDVGPSVERVITYYIPGVTETEKAIPSDGKIYFNEDGEYTLNVYSYDMALNKVEVEKTIKIDKTNPTPAEFVINGTKGLNDWYISDVTTSYEGASDETSGIQSVVLSQDTITENTDGTKVTLTTRDNAGNTVSKEVTIKIDKNAPTAPEINLTTLPTGNGFFGALMYNKDVSVKIIPGIDTFLPNEENIDRTTYKLTKNSGMTTLVDETEGAEFTITYEGTITITATTYDKAGNASSTDKVVWINKAKPTSPKLISINGTNVEDKPTSEIKSTSNVINLQIANLVEGNDLKVILINQETYEKIEIVNPTIKDNKITIELSETGQYSIKVTQTNMFGTESDESPGLYVYTYSKIEE